jgi:N-acyl-D-aspartate/D-glutamate deacylase
MTDVPARFFGLVNRGRIEKDFHADLVVFDPERIDAQELKILNDLPGDSPRLYAGSEGIKKVFVNGILTVDSGKPTEVLSGVILRSGSHTVTNKIPADA